MSWRLMAGILATFGLVLTLGCDGDLTEPRQDGIPASSPSQAQGAQNAESGIPLGVYGRVAGQGQLREGDWKISFAGWARGSAMHAPNQWTDHRWEGEEATGHLIVQFHDVSIPAVSGGKFTSTAIDKIVFVGRAESAAACHAAGGMVTTGEFNGEPGWELSFFFSDVGRGLGAAAADRVRLVLNDPSGVLVYYAVNHPDWDPPGEDFPMEGACLGPFRTELDAGNVAVRFE